MVPDCMGLVISAYEPNDKPIFHELSHAWYLQCPAGQHDEVSAETELRADEMSFVRICQTYPEEP